MKSLTGLLYPVLILLSTHSFAQKTRPDSNAVMPDDANSTVMNAEQQTRAPHLQDLIVTRVNVTDPEARSLTYDITIKNQGDMGILTSFHNYVYLTTDENIGDASDILIDDWYVNIGTFNYFPAGSSKHSGARTVNVCSQPAGDYFVGVVTDAESNIGESDETQNTGYAETPKVSIDFLGDLVLTEARITEISRNSHLLHVQYTIENQGNKNIGQPTDKFDIAAYLSTDDILETDHDLYISKTVDYHVLTAGRSYTRTAYIFVPGDLGLTQGGYCLGLYYDFNNVYEEQYEDNNSAIATNMLVTIPEALPDLVWAYPPFLKYIKDKLDFRWLSFYNYGWKDIIEPFSSRVLLSENKTMNKEDYSLLNKHHTDGLQMLERLHIEGSVSTHDIPGGHYFIIVKADGTDQITELNEDDNTLVSEYPIEIVHINLTYPNGDEIWIMKNPYTIQWTTEGTVPFIDVALYKDGQEYTILDTELANTGSYTYTPLAGLPEASSYQICISETDIHDEGTRTLDFSDDYFSILSHTAPLKPDLIIESFTVSDSTAPDIRFKSMVKNRGNCRAESSTVYIYLSGDTQIDSSDYHIHTWPLSGTLESGATVNSGDTTITVSDIAAGTLYLIAKADAENQIPESNEDNNTGIADHKITVLGKPDYHYADLDHDGDVDIRDIQLVAARYASYAGDNRYREICDIDGDGDIDIADIQKVAALYGRVF